MQTKAERKGGGSILPMICDGLHVLALSKRSTVAKILNASLKREAYNIIEIKKRSFLARSVTCLLICFVNVVCQTKLVTSFVSF